MTPPKGIRYSVYSRQIPDCLWSEVPVWIEKTVQGMLSQAVEDFGACVTIQHMNIITAPYMPPIVTLCICSEGANKPVDKYYREIKSEDVKPDSIRE